MKALLWEGDGFILLYKRLENGSFKWPRDESEVNPITWQQFRWLMEGLQVEQKQLTTLKGSALGKAVTYAKNQKSYMENYLLDGRCSISNNAAENAIRPFTVGRKNWLFADTPKGALHQLLYTVWLRPPKQMVLM